MKFIAPLVVAFVIWVVGSILPAFADDDATRQQFEADVNETNEILVHMRQGESLTDEQSARLQELSDRVNREFDILHPELKAATLKAKQEICDAKRRERAARRHHRTMVAVKAGCAIVTFPVYLGIGIAYSGVIGPVTAIVVWENTWF